MDQAHVPVLLDAALAALAVRAEGTYIDATFGRGGHAEAILARLGPEGRLFAIDRDPQACAVGRERHAGDARFYMTKGRFSMLARYTEDWGVAGKVDGILFDLGVSSPQLDVAERGFSFRQPGPLDMRMDPEEGVSAADWINDAKEQEIASVLRELGEERFARRITRAIVAEREARPIATTDRLAAIIAAAVPTRERGKDPATRSFQAIRMHVNQELPEIERALPQALDALAVGGRLAVISFHSLEDRIVKNFMRSEARGDPYPPNFPVRKQELKPRLKLLGKPVRASEEEIRRNPRARSAILRAAQRIASSHA